MRAIRVAALGGCAVLIAAVAVIAGWPDPGRAADLLTGRVVTSSTEAALVALLCWIAVGSLALLALRTLRRRHPGSARKGRLSSVAVLVIGTALLAGGIAHRSGYHVCCANPITAKQAAHLVH